MFNFRRMKKLEAQVKQLEVIINSLKEKVEYMEEEKRIEYKKAEMEELRQNVIEQYIEPQDLPLIIEIHYAGASLDEKFWLKIGEVIGNRNSPEWKKTCQYKGIYEFMGYPWEIKDLMKKGYIERIIKSWQWDNRDKLKSPWIAVDCSKY